MQEAGYIDSEMRAAQSIISRMVKPEQVLFFEFTSTHTGHELTKTYGNIPEKKVRRDAATEAVADHFSQFEGMGYDGQDERLDASYQLKEAASCLFSGQPNHQRLPLFLEPGLDKPIDRNAYPYIWEISRAAEIDDGLFLQTARLGLYFAARELVLLGGDPKEAYVFIRALDPVWARGFSIAHGLRFYSGYKAHPNWRTLVAPLSGLLDRLDVKRVSYRLSSLMTAMPGLSTWDALKIAFYTRQNRTEYPSRGGVTVQIRDFSNLPDYLVQRKLGHELAVAAMAESRPIVEYRDFLARSAEKHLYPYPAHIDGIRLPNGDIQELEAFLLENNAIEISAEGQPGDLLLSVAYWRAVERLAELGEPDPEATLKALGVRFVVYNAASSVPAVARWRLHSPHLQAREAIAFTSWTTTLREEILANAQAYAVEDVTPLARSLRSETDHFVRGAAHRRYYFSHPELMQP